MIKDVAVNSENDPHGEKDQPDDSGLPEIFPK